MPQSRSLLHAAKGALAVAGIALIASSCVVKTASSVACGKEERTSIDCSSEVSYQGYKADGGFGILNLASGKAQFEEVALRRISEATERYMAMHTRLCKDYNGCALDKQKYAAEAKDIRDKLEKVPVLVENVKRAPSDDDHTLAVGALYEHVVPEEDRLEEVALKLGMTADLPPEQGGKRIKVLPGTPLPTEARAWFWVEVTPKAYVYIFQKTPSGGVTVLFPDERIGTKNPLEGDTLVRIPNGELKFRVNDKDIGTENVYFAASRKPLTSLDEALARVREGKTTSISGDKLLSNIDALPTPGTKTSGCRGLELDIGAAPKGNCAKTRGLELDVSGGFGEGASIGAVTEPGDDLIVYKFWFEHTTSAGYTEALKKFEAQGPVKRGSVMIERRKKRGSVMIERSMPKNQDQ